MNSLLPLESSSLFSEVAGLPLHPLIVHVAVVVLPLSALAVVVLAFRRRWAERYGWLAVAGVAVGTVAAFVAKESGQALAERVGDPGIHASYGDVLPWIALALLVGSTVWMLGVQRGSRSGGGNGLRLAAGAVAAVVALVVIGLTLLVGHSGAEAVWGTTMSAPVPGRSASPAPTRPGTPTATPSGSTTPGTYTMADVAAHADASSCWAAIDGNVYDLTAWIAKHPGGPDHILALCGTDATSAFHQQHDDQQRPASELAGFQIGSLG